MMIASFQLSPGLRTSNMSFFFFYKMDFRFSDPLTYFKLLFSDYSFVFSKLTHLTLYSILSPLYSLLVKSVHPPPIF